MNKKTVALIVALILCAAAAVFFGIRLNQESSSLQEASGRLADVQAQLSQLEKEKTDLTVSLESEAQARGSAEEENTKLSDSLKASEAAAAESEKARAEALEEISKLQDALKAAEESLSAEMLAREAAQAENDALKAALAEAEAALAASPSAKTDSQTGSDAAGTLSPDEDLKTVSGDSVPETEKTGQTQPTSLIADSSDAPSAELLDLKNQIETLNASLSEVNAALAAEQAAREQLLAENADLSDSLTKIRADLEQANQARDAAVAEAEELKELVASGDASLSSEREARSAAEAALEEEKKQTSSLTQSLAGMTEERDALAASLVEEKEQSSSLSQSLAGMTEERNALAASLAEEKEQSSSLSQAVASLTEEKNAEAAAHSEKVESLTESLTQAEEKASSLEVQVADLNEQNDSLRLEASDLRGNADLAAQLPEKSPAPRLAAGSEQSTGLNWCRIRYDAKGYPQLWISLDDDNGMISVMFIRTFVNSGNESQTEIYDAYHLEGNVHAVRYRTLSLPGSYSLIVTNLKNDSRDLGRLVTLEDIDGNGIADTLTDWNGNIVLLEIENAFSVQDGH